MHSDLCKKPVQTKSFLYHPGVGKQMEGRYLGSTSRLKLVAFLFTTAFRFILLPVSPCRRELNLQ